MADEAFWIKQFERRANWPATWRLKADELLIAADMLLAKYKSVDTTTLKVGSTVPEALRVLSAALLLRAAGVEALLKGRAVRRGHRFAIKGRFQPVPGTGNGHDLVSLARATQFKLSPAEDSLLSHLTSQLEFGRYPMAKSWRTGLRMHAQRGVGYVDTGYSSGDEQLFARIVTRLRISVRPRLGRRAAERGAEADARSLIDAPQLIAGVGRARGDAMDGRSIFGSGAERAAFEGLRSRVGSAVDIFPQVSAKRTVGFECIQRLSDEKERDYLLGAEFDFVVCKKPSGIPVLVIEFDGMGGGFSQGARYVGAPGSAAGRHMKLEAKLRICAAAGIAAVVVALPETQPLDATCRLTALDVIVGEVVAAGILQASLDANLVGSVADVEEREATFSTTKDPIKIELSRLLSALDAPRTDDGMIKFHSPQHDRAGDGMVGCRTVIAFRGAEFTGTAYVRNIECAGFSAYGLAEDLSQLTAIKEAARCLPADHSLNHEPPNKRMQRTAHGKIRRHR